MLPKINSVKGVHPGAILKRELKKRKIKGIQLADAINEFPQTINAIINERRGINPKLSIKLGGFFGSEDDYFMLLQASYQVKKLTFDSPDSPHPLANKIRKSIFWDTKVERIDWHKNRQAVIQRVLERGNQSEIEALMEYYGLEVIREEIRRIENTFSTAYEENVEKYILNSVSR